MLGEWYESKLKPCISRKQEKIKTVKLDAYAIEQMKKLNVIRVFLCFLVLGIATASCGSKEKCPAFTEMDAPQEVRI